jgi:hypothetical protein
MFLFSMTFTQYKWSPSLDTIVEDSKKRRPILSNAEFQAEYAKLDQWTKEEIRAEDLFWVDDEFWAVEEEAYAQAYRVLDSRSRR